MSGITRTILSAAFIAAAACQGGNDRKETETAALDSAAAAARDSAAKANAKELEVQAVMIGRRIGGNNLITEPTFQFAPTDTVYLSVATVGSPDSAALAAVWVAQTGKTVDSTSETIRPKGHANTALRAAPTKGWAPGVYRVTIYSDGDSVDAKTFAVKK